MSLQYAKAERIWLKGNPNFSERWLHEQICDDASILGLGDLAVVGRERVQFASGRLDMLLSDADAEGGTRYEVEVMLGATDPSHIIRTIEYWDIERRRYPAYDHVAVLIAEEVTARFLNVIALFAGSIPIVAIQVNALRVGSQIVLNFVTVLDQRSLRVDDTATGVEEENEDRPTWENRVGQTIMRICDRLSDIANEIADPKLELKYKKGRVVLSPPGSFFNVLMFFPKKNFVPVWFRISDTEGCVKRLSDAGLEAELKSRGAHVLVRLRKGDLDQHEVLLREVIHQVVKEKAED